MEAKAQRNHCCSNGRGRPVHTYTRDELCNYIGALQSEKEDLRALTSQQHAAIRELERECTSLRAEVLKAGLADTGVGRDTYSENCVAGGTQRAGDVELDRLRGELGRLEQHRGHEAARRTWAADCRALEDRITHEHARLSALEGAARAEGDEQARRAAEQARCSSIAHRLREELAEQRHLHAEAEFDLRDAQFILADLHRQSQVLQQQSCSSSRCTLEMKARQAQRIDAHRRQRDELQAAMVELEVLQRDLQAVSADNVELRMGLQQTLDGFEHIQRQSAQAEEYARSLGPGVESLGFRSSHAFE